MDGGENSGRLTGFSAADNDI